MNKFIAVIKRKPSLFIIVSLGYLIIVGFLKWQLRPPLVGALLYLAGGALGVYFLDLAEVFFDLASSPFRSVVFAALFAIVSFFVVTSSGSLLASGLVLSLYLSLILGQIGEWQIAGNLSRWYEMVAGPVSVVTQKWLLVVFITIFIVETYLFIR